MCLAWPAETPAPDDSASVIEAVSRALIASGTAAEDELSSRPTARIGIVMFVDLATGLECDISMQNPLAVRNTELLAVYSSVDPRVGKLAYVIKHWAKRRRINNASEGTLSSYGYLLCLIHFLQTRSPPVLPNLQKLPPEWDAGEYS